MTQLGCHNIVCLVFFNKSVLWVHIMILRSQPSWSSYAAVWCTANVKQESPAIADKPARRESLPKLLQFDVPTALSLTILAYLHAFNCYCVRNPRNPEKFTENSNLWSSRSSKVIDISVNRKPICDLLLVINSNFSRICYRFRDIDAWRWKIADFTNPSRVQRPLAAERH